MVSDTDPSGLLAMSVVFIPLLVLVVSLRFYARAFSRLPLEIDDWLMLPALVSCSCATSSLDSDSDG